MSAPPQHRGALVVTAHPDDPEYLFGATVASLVCAGTTVDYLVCTDGSLGGDPGCPKEDLVALRSREQRAAAQVLGVRQVRFLGLSDGDVALAPGLRPAIVEEIRRLKPELVITHFPRRALAIPIEASHPDHVAVGETVLRAVYPDACNPRAFPELREQGLEPHRVAEVWLAGYEAPDHAVDAGPFLDRKIAAILCHRSQLPPGSAESPPDWLLEEMSLAGRRAGFAYAEEFKRIRL